jgi:hypothetical protein
MTAPTPVVWWLFPFVVGGGLGTLSALAVRVDAAERGADMQRRCSAHCLEAGLGEGTAEPRADACVCAEGGSQP